MIWEWRWFLLKRVKYSVINLQNFENIIKTPTEIDLPENAQILDLIVEIDKLYYRILAKQEEKQLKTFHNEMIKGILHFSNTF